MRRDYELIQENPTINLQNQAIKKAAELIEDDNLTPEERKAPKVSF